MSEQVFVGIDVSKDRLDVCVLPDAEKAAFENNDEGAEALGSKLAERGATLVVLEATGGLERLVVAHLVAKGLAVVVANPRRVRQYAQAAGILAKTDTLDAHVLACFAQDIRPERRPGRSPQEELMKELMARRNQLMRMRVAEMNRMTRMTDKGIIADIKAAVRFLDRQIAKVDERIDDEVNSNPTWKQTDDLLQSVPGVGKKTSRMVMAALPEIGTLSEKEAASLAGLAPFANDSGKMRGKRMISGGRVSVRRALYMATLVAIVHNEDIRTFYRRLRGAGKSGKVAVTASMRKLLITLNAVVARGSKWEPKRA